MAYFYVVDLNMKKETGSERGGAPETQTQTSSKMLIVWLIEGMFFVGSTFWRVLSVDCSRAQGNGWLSDVIVFDLLLHSGTGGFRRFQDKLRKKHTHAHRCA